MYHSETLCLIMLVPFSSLQSPCSGIGERYRRRHHENGIRREVVRNRVPDLHRTDPGVGTEFMDEMVVLGLMFFSLLRRNNVE